jgi:hypothetical protein
MMRRGAGAWVTSLQIGARTPSRTALMSNGGAVWDHPGGRGREETSLPWTPRVLSLPLWGRGDCNLRRLIVRRHTL